MTYAVTTVFISDPTDLCLLYLLGAHCEIPLPGMFIRTNVMFILDIISPDDSYYWVVHSPLLKSHFLVFLVIVITS